MGGYTYKYPHPAITTDCVVFGFDGQQLTVLLIERGGEPCKGMWAFPGGFMHIDESAEECALRELREETGLEITYIKQLGAFSAVNRDPRERVVTIAFYSLARQSEVRGGDDAASARWWAIGDVPQLAFDHDYILRQAMNRLRQDMHFEPVGFGLLDERFTIAELQRLYESILGIHFDRRNFYKKMLQTGILREVGGEGAEEHYYGRRREMKMMDIDSLFEPQSPYALPTTQMCCAAPAQDVDGEVGACDDAKPQRVGRKGRLFSFVKERYDQMKEDGKFRLEF